MHGSFRRTTAALSLAFALLVGCQHEPTRAEGTSSAPIATSRAAVHNVPPLVDELEHRTFDYFWDLDNPRNGLVPDRWPTPSFSSIAAVGFGLTAYGVGVERGWISREQAIDRTLTTLRFFAHAPQDADASGASGYKGFFYHFLEMDSGVRSGTNEVSTVDTSLLLGGILFAQSYYDRDDPREAEIRNLAEDIYGRVDWTWAQERSPRIAMGWTPEHGMIAYDWQGYNEAILVYILALGSTTHPVNKDAYDAWTATYDRTWGRFQGQDHLSFPPLFGHQYSQVWIDFRGIRDDYMRKRGIDYFENSRRAVLSQQAYAIENPSRWEGYGRNVWGLTASDGPVDASFEYKGETRLFHTYAPRGAGIGYVLDDGTIAPTAAAGSIAFAPDIAIPAIEEMQRRYGKQIYSRYGFLDAFNPSFTFTDAKLHHGKIIDGIWVDGDYLGIDEGPIVLMIENYRSDFVWGVMRRNPHIRRGLERAGFSGGWLDHARAVDAKGAAAPTLH